MKERLTGAIILVALIVLLVPELLTGPIRTKSAVAASSVAAVGAVRTAPAQPPLRSYTLTLGAPPPANESLAAPATPGRKQPAEGSAGEASAESAAQSLPQTEPAASQAAMSNADAPRASMRSTRGDSALQVAKPAAYPAMREAGSSASAGGWVVQLGSFASRENADRLARSLERKGFHMAVSPARTGSRVLWRVRAGPAHDRSGAQHLAARLQALGHRGELLPGR